MTAWFAGVLAFSKLLCVGSCEALLRREQELAEKEARPVAHFDAIRAFGFSSFFLLLGPFGVPGLSRSAGLQSASTM